MLIFGYVNGTLQGCGWGGKGGRGEHILYQCCEFIGTHRAQLYMVIQLSALVSKTMRKERSSCIEKIKGYGRQSKLQLSNTKLNSIET